MRRVCQPPEGLYREVAPLIFALVGGQMGLRSNLKKLIQVGRHDAQITKTLQQRNVFTISPIEHSLVERENTVISIQQLHE
jgi:hypothetical protein